MSRRSSFRRCQKPRHDSSAAHFSERRPVPALGTGCSRGADYRVRVVAHCRGHGSQAGLKHFDGRLSHQRPSGDRLVVSDLATCPRGGARWQAPVLDHAPVFVEAASRREGAVHTRVHQRAPARGPNGHSRSRRISRRLAALRGCCGCSSRRPWFCSFPPLHWLP